MRALRVPQFGGPEVLRWQDVSEEPVPEPGEVLVRVRAVAVNWADLLQRQGKYPGGPEPPYTSGHDLVAEVVSYGQGVVGPPPGSRVFGVMGRHGAAAELFAAPAVWFYPVPDRLTDEEAAGAAGPYMTADAALMTMGGFQEGQSVLVHAAAGAFGSAGVQLARAYGAGTIIATAGSPERQERVREFGADIVSGYEDFVDAAMEATGGRGVDLVLESVGGDVLGRSLHCVVPAGRLISVGASSGRSSDRFRLHTLFVKGILVGGFTLGVWLQENPALVAPTAERVLDVLARGMVKPVVDKVFKVDEAADAHRYMQERRSVGRTVIVL